MRPSAAQRSVAWSLWALALALTGARVLLLALGSPHLPPGEGLDLSEVVMGAATITLPTVGVLIVSRRGENRIGWLFCVAGALFAFELFCFEYASYALRARPGALPLGAEAAWLGSLGGGAVLTLLIILPLLLFPDGRPASRAWGRVGWVVVGALVVVTPAGALRPGPLPDVPWLDNPFGVPSPVLSVLGSLSYPIAGVGALAAAVSLVARYRRSRGSERRQIQWVAYAGGVAVVSLQLWWIPSAKGWLAPLATALTVFAGIPAAVGVAIIRYRLYDIDRIISRTVTYALVTAVLVGLYAGIAVGAASLFGGGSDLLVAGATLAAAALFRPLRRRVQGVVDRRFNRSRYDAERTIEAFAARLRDEVDLDALAAELRGVVSSTVAPAHVSLWTPGGAG